MKRSHLVTILVLAGGLALAGAWWFVRTPGAAEIFPAESISVDGMSRAFRLVVPRSPPTEESAIVFAFHGIGDSTASMSANTNLDLLARRNEFILVYPATRRFMWDTAGTREEDWNANPDIRFFDALLDNLSARFRIDRRRVYAAGMSNGATFVQLLATARSRRIAAVVAHSGPTPKPLERAERAFPILLIAGQDDFAVHAMRSDARQYRSNGHLAEFIPVPNLGHAWSTRHNAAIWEFLSKHRLEP